jgi:hypothetical protein
MVLSSPSSRTICKGLSRTLQAESLTTPYLSEENAPRVHVRHGDDILAVLLSIQESYPVGALHDGGGRVAQKLGLGPQLASNDDIVVHRDVVESRDGRVMRDLLCDVEPDCAVWVVVATPEDFAQDRIVSAKSRVQESIWTLELQLTAS